MKRLLLLLLLLLVASPAWAVDTDIAALPDATSVATTDSLECNQSNTSRECTVAQIATGISKGTGGVQYFKLGSNYTNSSTTGTEITGIGPMTVSAGTFYLSCRLLFQTAATTTSVKFGVNYTGTTTSMAANVYFPSAGVTAATGTFHDANNATTGQVWAYANTRTETTTAPNLGPWVGTTNANVDHLLHLDALLIVSNGGDIELWAGSEVAASQIQITAGSFCSVTTL